MPPCVEFDEQRLDFPELHSLTPVEDVVVVHAQEHHVRFDVTSEIRIPTHPQPAQMRKLFASSTAA